MKKHKVQEKNMTNIIYKNIGIKTTEEMWRWFRCHCDESGRKVSYVVGKILEDYKKNTDKKS